MDLFIFIFSLAIGVLCFWASVRLLRIYFNVRKWDKVHASILSKSVQRHTRVSTPRSRYAVKAEYKYFWKGKEYMNHTIYLVELINGQVNHMKSTAEKKLEKIQDGMVIYVNPKNPKEAVLFCEGVVMYFFIFLMGLLSIIIGTAYFPTVG